MKRWLPDPVITALAGFLLLATPLLLRAATGQALIAGVASYESLLATSTPYGFLLELLEPIGEARALLSPLLGLITALLFARAAKLLFRRGEAHRLATLLLITNPLYLGLFTSLNPYTVSAPLLLAASMKRTRGALLAGAAAAATTPIFSLLSFGTLALLHEQRRYKLPLLLSILALPLASPGPAGLLVAEFGAPLGASLFYLSLAFLEGASGWPASRKELLLFGGLLVASPFLRGALILLGLLATIPAASFINRLRRRRWTLRATRRFTLLLITCSFLFLVISHELVIASQAPTGQLSTILQLLPGDERRVLAPPALGPIIKVVGRHDPFLQRGECPSAACDEAARLYRARRLPDAAPILERNGIGYLLITREMREGLVWRRHDEGLLFLLQHSSAFRKLGENEEVELWAYEPRREEKEGEEVGGRAAKR